MKLQGRNLKPNMRGDDVRLLQDELRELGFPIPEQERLFGTATASAVRAFQSQHDLPATGIVDAKTARVINADLDALPREGYLVKGRLVRADGSPVAEATITVVEKQVRRENDLGTSRTGRRGDFEVTYPEPNETQLPLSILVRATGPSNDELAVSDLICDPGPVEEVTLVTGGEALRGPSEYRQLEEVLKPALNAEDLDPRELNEADIEFLACKFNLNPEHIALFVVSARHSHETDVTAEMLYGLLRQGLPTDLAALVALAQETLREALAASIEEGIISPQSDRAIRRMLRALQDHIVHLALRDPAPDRPTFAALFKIAEVDDRQRQRILRDYAGRRGTVEGFWQQLREDPDIENEELDALLDTLALSTIAANHLPLVVHLRGLRQTGGLGPDLRDLARFDQEEWREILGRDVAGSRIGAPAFFGEDEEERIGRYAGFLPRMVESIHPTAVLTESLARIDNSDVEFGPAVRFLRSNPEFEFRDTLLRDYLDQNEDALVGIPNPEETVGTLQRMQRLFRVAPDFNKAQAVATLMARDIDSATAIRRKGAPQFIRENLNTFGREAAEQMYTKAARAADEAVYLLSQSVAFNPIWTAVIPPQVFGQNIPDLEDLFGALNLCQCRHCESVFGPAAYLVEILHFLSNRPGDVPSRRALDVLFDRRPDIGEIELTCHNTNTALPYVDLLLEILEAAVVSGGTLTINEDDDDDDLFPFQTIGDEESLGANPEHQNEQAYEIIRNAAYPWQLPFDLWYTEVRGYLGHLGVAFHEVMSEFSFPDSPDSEAALAAEYLGLTPRDRELITSSGGDSLASLWGFDIQAEFDSFLTNRNAGQLRDRSSLTYDELNILLLVNYIDPSGNLQIRFDGADCDLDTAVITNLNGGALERIQRFVHLWRRQPWSIESLGAILRALRAGEQNSAFELNDDVLIQLSTITRLHRDLRVHLSILLNWLADRISSTGKDDQPSLYEEVFLDPTVHNPELAIFALNAARTDLASNFDPLSSHAALTSNALGISVADLNFLIETELENTTLNLSNLTRLYQAASLARALGITVREYRSLRGLTGIDPFGTGAVDRLTQIVELARRVRNTPFTIAQLDYLLRHQETGASPVGPTVEEITATLVVLRTALHEIALDHQLPESSDAILQMTEKKLAMMLRPEVAGQILAIVNLSSNQSQDDQSALIGDHLALFMDPSAIIEDWFADEEAGQTIEPAERALMVLSPLVQHLQRIANEDLVIETMATAHTTSVAVSESLLRTFIPAPGGGESLIDVFLADDFVPQPSDSEPSPDFAETTTAETFAPQFSSYQRMAIVAFVIRAFEVPLDGLEFYFSRGIASGWLDLNALPLEPVEEAATDLPAFLSQAELFQLSKSLFGGLTPLFDLLRPLENIIIDRQAFLLAVSSLTEWESDDVSFLTGPSTRNLQFPEGFRNGLFLLQLKAQFDMLRQLSESAEAVHQWASQPVSAATAQTVKQTIRARYEDKTHWLTVAKPLRDDIREQQRSAMVGHLVHTLGLESSNALYGHFLIDVEMSPCMLTTRIALAISSVQLFVQRCLLNLEEVELSPKDAEEWTWLKHYREREAARRVLVNPENYLHPELRDDKTPFFEQLEGGLLQGEVDELAAQREFRKYLNELSHVANLEISGVTRQWDVHRDILHAFGRTRNTPHDYYYRRWVNQRYWTPWERIDVDIDGEHIIPVVWQERLFLFWPIFMEKAKEGIVADDEIPPPPKRYYDIQMAWSEYRDGDWLPTQVSDNFISSVPTFKLQRRSAFRFWPQVDALNRLYIVSNLWGRQFRFDSHGSQLRANAQVLLQNQLKWIPFQPVSPKIRSPFPGTGPEHNKLKESSGTSKPLIVFTAGETVKSPIAQYLENIKSSLILASTPRRFELVLPSEEQLFVSRSPFFYSDQLRSFLVVPRGGYTGGFASPGFGLSPAANPTHVPLELPDAVTWVMANSTVPTPRDSIAIEATGEIEPERDLATLLSSSTAITMALSAMQWESKFFRFDNHYHPYIPLLIDQLNRHGIDGVLKPDPEKEPQRSDLINTLRRQSLIKIFFPLDYKPTKELVDNVKDIVNPLLQPAITPLDEFDFSYAGAYSVYNWELFFHVPFMLAKRLSENQQFAAAQRWFHYIFDPTHAPQDPAQEPWPDHVWQIKPFYAQAKGQSVQQSMLLLHSTDLSSEERTRRKQIRDQIEAWRKDPYNPHKLARLGNQTYMKAVVMAYLDNLIAWGDHLFRLDTRESINEATQLFILADEILGDRPEDIAAHEDARRTINGEEVRTFNDLRNRLDEFSNALVELETQLEPMETAPGGSGGAISLVGAGDFAFEVGGGGDDDDDDSDLPLAVPGFEPPDDNPPVPDLPLATPIPAILGPSLFFCIPKNDKLLGYWDTVADRLFKLRHCMNIEGVVRHVPPFQPPIDPDLLVKAAAAGIDISSALRDLNAPLSHYRFQVLTQKASELVNEVKSLGSALLSALEKKDSEALALIRAGHEIDVLQLTEQVRIKQHEEAIEQKNALHESRALAVTRYAHYENQLGPPVSSPPIGIKIPLRTSPPNVRFDNVERTDLQTTGTDIKAGLSLDELVEAVINLVVSKTPLGKIKDTLEQIPLLGKGIEKIFDRGIPSAGEFLTDLLPLNNLSLDLSTFFDDESQELKVELDDFLKDLKALRMLLQEKGELNLLSESKRFGLGAGSHREVAARWQASPTATISVAPFGLGLSTSIGGQNISAAVSAKAESLRSQSENLSFGATLTSKVGQYILRGHEWTLQSNLAAREIMQIDKQLTVADVRIASAEKELTSHRKQMENSRETEAFMQNKYTNKELYSWMVGQISNAYLQAYQLAYDFAKAAERAYSYELGLEESSFIKPGHWINLKKGLLAGEKLSHDLKRMELAYLEENRREYELSKSVSLVALNPEALLRLKEEGRCEFDIPEALFDMDYAGHYFRRIKSVSLTVPAVIGPYTTLACTLRLLHSSIRRKSTLPNGEYARDLDNDDPRFSDRFGAIPSIATSSGQNDSGLFELNFRDERYLPFEGAGVISGWVLEMADEFRQFDYDSISDVILHIKYTAREGGGVLRDATNQSLQAGINAMVTGADAPGLVQALSARHDFSAEFHRFLNPAGESEPQSLTLNIAQNRFPHMFKSRNIIVDQAHVFVRFSDDFTDADGAGTEFTLTHPGGGEDPVDLDTATPFGNMRQVSISPINTTSGEWTLTVSGVGDGLADESNQLNPNAIEDIIFILHYTVEEGQNRTHS